MSSWFEGAAPVTKTKGGIWTSCRRARIRNSLPSIPLMTRSHRTKDGLSVRRTSSASLPPDTPLAWYPASFRHSTTLSRPSSSSSTTRTHFAAEPIDLDRGLALLCLTVSPEGPLRKSVALCGIEGRRWKHPTTGSTTIPASESLQKCEHPVGWPEAGRASLQRLELSESLLFHREVGLDTPVRRRRARVPSHSSSEVTSTPGAQRSLVDDTGCVQGCAPRVEGIGLSAPFPHAADDHRIAAHRACLFAQPLDHEVGSLLV
jgi:hypothetical protein